MATNQPSAQALDDEPKKPEDMGLWVGRLITAVAFLVPALVLALLGLWIGNENTAGGLVVIWLGSLFAASIQVQQKRTFTVVERFGKLWDVKFAGFRLIIPYIDNKILRENFLQKSVVLFKDIAIDFIGGSAPILADGWYQIANPDDLDDGSDAAMERVKEQVLKYTYRVRAANRAARVAVIFQGAFRTFLEHVDIATAQEKMEELATDGTDAAQEALKEIGVYPFPKKGIIVQDIVLPEAITKLREQVLRGEMDAKEAVARAQVYWQPLTEMKKGFSSAGAGKMDFADDVLLRLFLAQKGFETLPKIPAHVSLIAKDIDGIQKVITVGGVGIEKGD